MKKELSPLMKMVDKLLEEEYPDNVVSDKWINVFINKLGKSFEGKIIYPSLELALIEAQTIDNFIKQARLGNIKRKLTIEEENIVKNYAYCLQMPKQTLKGKKKYEN